jgi:hypothetical protein
MSAPAARRLLAGLGLLCLITGYLVAWPASGALIGLAAAIGLVLVLGRPKQTDLAARAAAACEDPDLMTIWEVAELARTPAKTVVLALHRDGVPRADRLGWRARLPVPMTEIRYQRADITRWLATQHKGPVAN